MKNLRRLLSITAVTVIVLSSCPTDTGGGGGTDYSNLPEREAHLAMLRNLGVNVDNPIRPLAPNGKPYNPASSSGSRATVVDTTMGPLGKTFSNPKREIFVAGYGNISGGAANTNHALYEDFSNLSSLSIIGQDSVNDSGWAAAEDGGSRRKAVAADLDGDGIDEVVIVVAVKNSSKIYIYKGEYKNETFTITRIPTELTARETIDDMIPFNTNNEHLGLIGWKLIAADLNGDGKQECIFTLPGKQGMYMYILNNDLTVLRQFEDLKARYAPDAPAGQGYRYFPMVTAADYDQDGKDELCLMFGVNVATFNAPFVILDDQDTDFKELYRDKVGNTNARIRMGNLIAADFTGDGLPDTVFYGPGTNSNNNVLVFLKTTLDGNFQPRFESVSSANMTDKGIVNNSLFPRLAAGDVNGDKKTDLYFWNRLWNFKDTKFEQITTIDHVFNLTDKDMYDVVIGDVSGDQKDDVVVFYGGGQIEIFYENGGTYTRTTKNIASSSFAETGCLPNVDDDSFILRDTGDRELLFTDPHVIAVLASPPYYEGVNEGGEGGTSFGYSKSAGSSSSNTFGFSVGVSVGCEFSAPFGLASASFEQSITSSFGWTQSKSIQITESWGWNTPVAQDLVVFTAIPFDVYYYEVLRAPSTGGGADPAKAGDIMTISVPRKPQPYHSPLEMYNAGVSSEHRVTLNHVRGVPTSYYKPDDREEQKKIAEDEGLFSTTTEMTAGAGYGSTTINIEKIKEEESSFSFDLERTISASVGAGGVTVGASAGFSYGYESTSSVGAGTYIEGTVPAIPMGSYSSTLDFNWGLMAYPKKETYQQYVLVTYWVDLYN